MPPPKSVRIVIPRWAQLVLLPLLLLLVWTVAGAVRHVVFLFLVRCSSPSSSIRWCGVSGGRGSHVEQRLRSSISHSQR
jgi:hypothetical protein